VSSLCIGYPIQKSPTWRCERKKHMKKLFGLFAVIGVAVGIFIGCSTLSSLTPTQQAVIGQSITAIADSGAVYAIQQDKTSAGYFKLVDAVIDNFVIGTNLSPATLQSALSQVVGTNAWVGVAVNGAVIAYEVAAEQYGSQVTNGIAIAWITDIETGFKEALQSTGTTGLKTALVVAPDFIKNGKIDRDVIVQRIRTAGKH